MGEIGFRSLYFTLFVGTPFSCISKTKGEREGEEEFADGGFIYFARLLADGAFPSQRLYFPAAHIIHRLLSLPPSSSPHHVWRVNNNVTLLVSCRNTFSKLRRGETICPDRHDDGERRGEGEPSSFFSSHGSYKKTLEENNLDVIIGRHPA